MSISAFATDIVWHRFNEVTILTIGDTHINNILILVRADSLKRVSQTHPFYDVLQCILLFWRIGEISSLSVFQWLKLKYKCKLQKLKACYPQFISIFTYLRDDQNNLFNYASNKNIFVYIFLTLCQQAAIDIWNTLLCSDQGALKCVNSFPFTVLHYKSDDLWIIK